MSTAIWQVTRVPMLDNVDQAELADLVLEGGDLHWTLDAAKAGILHDVNGARTETIKHSPPGGEDLPRLLKDIRLYPVPGKDHVYGWTDPDTGEVWRVTRKEVEGTPWEASLPARRLQTITYCDREEQLVKLLEFCDDQHVDYEQPEAVSISYCPVH